MTRPGLKLVQSPSKWAVLASPARSELVEALRTRGPCSVAEIAELTGRPADGLYPHLERLRRAGFVRELAPRKVGRHVQRLFDTTADDFQVDFKGSGGRAENDAIIAMAKVFLHAAQRAVQRSARAGRLRYSPEDRNIAISYELSWLTPAAFARVRRHVRAIKAVMDRAKFQRQGELYLTLAIATPVTRKPRRGQTRSTPGLRGATTSKHPVKSRSIS